MPKEKELEKPKKSKKLFIIIASVLGAVLILLAAYFIYDELIVEDTEDINVAELSKPEESNCQGKYFDTHTHWDESDFVETAAALMKKHDIGCQVVFTGMLNQEDDNPGEKLEDFNDYKGHFVPFFHVNPQTPEDINVEKLKTVLDKYPNYFKGFGEVAFYRDPFKNSHLNDPNWHPVFELMAEKNLVLMIHLRGVEQKQELEEMLATYPNTKVLIHGFEMPREMPELLTKYKNLHFTLDTATLLRSESGSITMFPESMKKDDFLNAYNSDKDYMLKNSLNVWLPTINAAPDRVMWGTDIALPWHTDAEVYDKLVEYSNDFVKTLPAEVQENYTHKNAINLFFN